MKWVMIQKCEEPRELPTIELPIIDDAPKKHKHSKLWKLAHHMLRSDLWCNKIGAVAFIGLGCISTYIGSDATLGVLCGLLGLGMIAAKEPVIH